MRHRERGARARARAADSRDIARALSACRSSSRRRTTRRTAPPVARSAGPGSTKGCASSAAVKSRSRRADPDRHPRAGAGGAGRRGRRRAADSRVPLRGRPICSSPRRGPAASSTSRRASSSRPTTCGTRSRRSRDAGNPQRARHRARHQLRLPQPGRRHARVSDDARARRPGRVRRHAQPAAAGRRRRRHRRPRASTSSRWRRPASPPASTACFSKSTRIRARAKSDAQNALRLDLLEPLLRRLMAIDAIAKRAERAAHGWSRAAMADLALARKVLETEAAAILALVDRLDDRFERAVELLRDCRGRVILTGMGKSGIICRKIAATLVEHRHAGVLPPSRRSDSRRPRRHPARRRRDRAVVQRRDRRDAAAARDDPARSARS